MKKVRPIHLFCVLSSAVLLGGCIKSKNQSSTADTSATAPSGPDSDSNASGRSASAPKAAALVVPADTEIRVVLDQEVSSKKSSTGETFSATVGVPIEVDGVVAVPKGARASGIVKDAKAAGRFKGGAVLELALTSVTIGDKDYELQTSAHTYTSKGKGKRTAEMVGGGAGGGAAIGAVAGGGKGAAIGALVGAAAGTGGAGLTGNRDITLTAETALRFKLLQPVEITNK